VRASAGVLLRKELLFGEAICSADCVPNPRNSQDQISKNGRLAYVSQRPSGSAALLLVVTEAKSPGLRKPRRLDWIRAKARFELSMLLVRTKTAGQKGAFAHDDYRM